MSFSRARGPAATIMRGRFGFHPSEADPAVVKCRFGPRLGWRGVAFGGREGTHPRLPAQVHGTDLLSYRCPLSLSVDTLAGWKSLDVRSISALRWSELVGTGSRDTAGSAGGVARRAASVIGSPRSCRGLSIRRVNTSAWSARRRSSRGRASQPRGCTGSRPSRSPGRWSWSLGARRIGRRQP